MQTPHDLRAWLTGALEGGVANDVSVRLRGDLAHFPFHGEHAAQGEFRVAGKLTEGKLNYSPNHYLQDGKVLGKDGKPLPLWPQAEHIKGSFVFDRARMEIHGDTATTGGAAHQFPRRLAALLALVACRDAAAQGDADLVVQ